MNDSITRIKEHNLAQSQQRQAVADKQLTASQFNSVNNTLVSAISSLITFLKTHEAATQVTNFPTHPTSIKTPDVASVVTALSKLEKSLAPTPVDLKGVEKQLTGIAQQLNKPLQVAELPEPLEAVTVKNLSQITDSLASVIKAINGLDVKPKVDVAAPVVNVPAPDLSSFTKALGELKSSITSLSFPTTDLEPLIAAQEINLAAIREVSQAINSLKFPVSTVPTDPLIRYTPADVDDVPTVQYFGFIAMDGHWYIKRFDTSVTPKTIRFAFGDKTYSSNAGYPQAFINRAGLTYNYWGS